MFGKHRQRRRYVHGRDAEGHRLRLFTVPMRGQGVALYRRARAQDQLLAVVPFLETGVLRREIYDAMTLAAWPEQDQDSDR